MRTAFWLSIAGVLYPYFGYPFVLIVLRRLAATTVVAVGDDRAPSVTLIVPAHNEGARIEAKIRNCAALNYPPSRLEVLLISDGSTDDTVAIMRRAAGPGMTVVALAERRGKGAALNAGLQRATHDLIVFSDSSIALEKDALANIVRPFRDPSVGCVSGEDRIAEADGEGLYGRYELMLRRLESSVYSIVGASGSFYAQRRALCPSFVEGLAPDFLSVLHTVQHGYRAVAEPAAVGYMKSVMDPRHEFDRKVRTLIRGLTTLFHYPQLLNPVAHGRFAFMLLSHKLLRWLAPFFMIAALASAFALREADLYLVALVTQLAFYAIGAAAVCRRAGVDQVAAGRIAGYLVSSNAAVLVAWWQYLRGVRRELWTPSLR